MRILFLSQYFHPEIGAPQVRLAAMIRALKGQGHEVEVITAMPNYPEGVIHPGYRDRVYLKEELQGIPVHRVWVYAATGSGKKRILNYLSFMISSFFGLLKAKKADYIFVESPPLFVGLPAVLISLFNKVPIIFNVADLWPDSIEELGFISDGLTLRILKKLEIFLYRKSTFVCAVTEGIKKTLLEEKKVPDKKVLFLPNGVDTHMFYPRDYETELAKQLGIQDRVVILYAGTIGYAQGLDVMLKAMALLENELPEVLMVFIGSGSDRERLQKVCKELQLTNVRFLDPQPPEYVARLYSIAFAGFASLINIPMFEGARPSKVFPIMGSGKPVLYSGFGEGANLINTAKAGLVAKPEDSAALATAIKALVTDPEKAVRMGTNGRNYVEKHLSWAFLIQDWLRQVDSKGGTRENNKLLP